MDLKELLATPDQMQQHYITTMLGQENSCIVFNAVKTFQQAHGTVFFDVALLRQLRYLATVETAVDYYNRSKLVTQRIMARPDSAVVWGEIYNQYIPGIATLATTGDATGAWAGIMAMLTKVESQY